MAEELGGIYNTKIPEYSDNADIQEAFKLFLYGTTTIPSDLDSVTSPSLAGHLKSLKTSITTLEGTGVGSDYSATTPANPVDGFIWVDANSTSPIISVPTWQLIDSGDLSGTSVSVSGISGEKFYMILKDWGHSNSEDTLGLVVRFNSDSGPNYVNTGGLLSASGLYSPEFANTATQDLTIEVDLANTSAMLKPVATIADTAPGPYFGYYKNVLEISSIQITLSGDGTFDTGSYEVWSYQ